MSTRRPALSLCSSKHEIKVIGVNEIICKINSGCTHAEIMVVEHLE